MKKIMRPIKAIATVLALSLAFSPVGATGGLFTGTGCIAEVQAATTDNDDVDTEYDKANVEVLHKDGIFSMEPGSPTVTTNVDSLNGYSLAKNSVYTLVSISWWQDGAFYVDPDKDTIQEGTLKVYLKLSAAKGYIFPKTLNVTYNGETDVWNRENSIEKSANEYYSNGGCRYVKSFEIKKPTIDISDGKIDAIPDQTYTGDDIEPEVTVTCSGKTLEKDTDYEVSYSDNVEPGTAKVTVTGIGEYEGTLETTFKIKKEEATTETTTEATTEKKIAPKVLDPTVSMDNVVVDDVPACDYTGKKVTPDIKLSYNDNELVKDTDYTVKYSNNISPGTAKATVIGKGKYTGKKVVEFTIKTPGKKYTFTVGGYKYEITKPVSGKKMGEVKVIGAKKKNIKKIVIADKVKFEGKKYKVTSVGSKAFKDYKKAKSLRIGKYVKKINSGAFTNCRKLKKMLIVSANISKMDTEAFKGTPKYKAWVPKKKVKAYKKMMIKAGASNNIKVVKK